MNKYNSKINDLKYDTLNEIWEVVNKVYPLFNERKVDWEKTREQYLRKIKYLKKVDEIYGTIDDMLLELKDPHTRIFNNLSIDYNSIPFFVIKNGNDLFITYVKDNSLLKPGMKIYNINGVPINEYRDKVFRKFNFNSLNMRYSAFITYITNYISQNSVEIIAGNEDKKVKEVFEPKTIKKKELNNFNVSDSNKIDYCTTRLLNNNIGYIRISSFRNSKVVDDFKKALKVCETCTSLVIDIRANHGGLIEETMTITSILAKKEKHIGYKVKRKVDGGYSDFDKPIKITVRPLENKRFKFENIAIICDENTRSSAEFIFLKGLKSTDERIKIFGTETAGLVHEATCYTLFDNTKFQITNMKYLSEDMVLLKEEGIKPDIITINSIQDMFSYRDNQLKKAIEFCEFR